MRFFTIGNGGRSPRDFVALLVAHGVREVVDVRLRPDRASMGCYVRAREPSKGIEKLLSDAGIGYRALVELGNVFREYDDWGALYEQLMERAGDSLTMRLSAATEPFCLLCAEKHVAERHRRAIADYLVARKGWILAGHLE